MKTNSHSENLALTIALLESRQQDEWLDIKDHVTIIKENLKPINLFKTVVGEIKDTIGTNNLLKIALGLSTEYIIQKIVVKKTENKFLSFFINQLLSLVVTKFRQGLKNSH
jgi:hypothetical protein